MISLSKCCCCVPVKTGVYIIGFLHLAGLILGIFTVNPIQISLEIFCGVTFVRMLYRDNAQSRLFYFAAYVVYVGIVGVLRLVFVFWDKNEKQMVRDYCEAVDSKIVQGNPDNWANTEYESLADCKAKVSSAVTRDEFIYVSIGLLLQLHFVLVVFTHYKNAPLTKSKGGTVADNDPDI